jgi:hypothetical protein
MQDIMIDLETLATTPDAAILTIGAVRFDPFGYEEDDSKMESFYVRVDLDSCNELGLFVDDNTIEWWASQSAEAQEEAFSPVDRVSISDAFQQLYKFAWGANRFWANGAGFDIPICDTVYRRLERSAPWKFWQVRDVRTAFDLGINPKLPKVTAHNALVDAYHQAVGIQNVYRVLASSTKSDGSYLAPFSKQQ